MSQLTVSGIITACL